MNSCEETVAWADLKEGDTGGWLLTLLPKPAMQFSFQGDAGCEAW